MRSGASARNCHWTRLGSVAGQGFHPRCLRRCHTPTRPAERISRATRLLSTRVPSPRPSSACTRARYVGASGRVVHPGDGLGQLRVRPGPDGRRPAADIATRSSPTSTLAGPGRTPLEGTHRRRARRPAGTYSGRTFSLAMQADTRSGVFCLYLQLPALALILRQLEFVSSRQPRLSAQAHLIYGLPPPRTRLADTQVPGDSGNQFT